MNELVILSGKGGTGKTSVTAALAMLASQAVLADCDVDASNLPLVLNPQLRRQEIFTGGLRAVIHSDECLACETGRRLTWLSAALESPLAKRPVRRVHLQLSIHRPHHPQWPARHALQGRAQSGR